MLEYVQILVDSNFNYLFSGDVLDLFILCLLVGIAFLLLFVYGLFWEEGDDAFDCLALVKEGLDHCVVVYHFFCS